MDRRWLRLQDCRFDLVTDGDASVGLGRIEVGQTLVRSGRLPLQPYSQTFTGLASAVAGEKPNSARPKADDRIVPKLKAKWPHEGPV